MSDNNNTLQQQLIKIFQDNYQSVMAFHEQAIEDFQSQIHE